SALDIIDDTWKYGRKVYGERKRKSICKQPWKMVLILVLAQGAVLHHVRRSLCACEVVASGCGARRAGSLRKAQSR
ncbi:hypothetical protein A2U01_0028091, partial [Trifolium medium]|nr:hypothetical protein [Trifolium medium]